MSKRKRPADSTADDSVLEIKYKFKLLFEKFNLTKKQKDFLKLAFDEDTKIVFLLGPAGSSKTFIATYAALQLFSMNNEYDIFYVRTIAESAERSLGSLPGDVEEKFDPFMMPLREKLQEILKMQSVKTLFNEEVISCAPINYLRGASWKNKLLICDEAQNFTRKELVTLITRIGDNCKYFICGDLMQSDINGKSGLAPISSIFADSESAKNGIHVFEFGKEDILRSEILKFIISRLEN